MGKTTVSHSNDNDNAENVGRLTHATTRHIGRDCNLRPRQNPVLVSLIFTYRNDKAQKENNIH